MTDIRHALEQGILQLKKNYPEARLESEILLAEALGKNRAYLLAHPEKILNQEVVETFSNYIQQRAEGVPIAYITGYRDFWSLRLKVNKYTLIPRHETERLVELALELIPDEPNTRILDLGTGSGAIALAIAKEKPQWQIDACDKSSEALEVARYNAQGNQLKNVHFYQSDWFNNLGPQKYHAIVSNPPYIRPEDPYLEQGDLRFEPTNALVSSQEGLADLQYIAQQAVHWLLPNGLLLLEHGYQQNHPIRSILNKLKYKDIHCWQDIQGHDRVSGGRCPDENV